MDSTKGLKPFSHLSDRRGSSRERVCVKDERPKIKGRFRAFIYRAPWQSAYLIMLSREQCLASPIGDRGACVPSLVERGCQMQFRVLKVTSRYKSFQIREFRSLKNRFESLWIVAERVGQ